MPKNRWMAVIVVAVILVGAAPRIFAESATTEQITSAWKLRQAEARSFIAEWTSQLTTMKGMKGQNANGAPNPSSDLTHPITWRFACDGNKVRLTRSGVEWNLNANDFVKQDFIRVFDGTERRELFANAIPNARPGGFLNDDKRFDGGDWRIQPIIMAFRPLVREMGAIDLNDWRPTTNREITTEPGHHVLEWKRHKDVFEMLHLTGLPDYHPVRREMYVYNNLKEQLTIDWQRNDDGRFEVKGWTQIDRLPNGELEKTTIVSSVNIAINPGTDSTEFVYQFPAGVIVTHERTNNLAIAREDGSLRPIANGELAAGIPLSELMKTDPPRGVAPFAGERSSWSPYMIIGVVAGAIVILGFRSWRRRASLR